MPLCQAELDRLHQRVARLKALPTLRPARDRWPETAARFRADRGFDGASGRWGLPAWRRQPRWRWQ